MRLFSEASEFQHFFYVFLDLGPGGRFFQWYGSLESRRFLEEVFCRR